MLSLKDLFHLPQVDPILEMIKQDKQGLIVIAGIDPGFNLQAEISTPISPSGRAGIFRILGREILEDNREIFATIIAERKEVFRIPRGLRSRVNLELVDSIDELDGTISRLQHSQINLLIVDRLTPHNARILLDAAQQGHRVLAQMVTVFRGVDIARVLLEWDVPRDKLSSLQWVITVDRVPVLCNCKRKCVIETSLFETIKQRYPYLEVKEHHPYYKAVGCEACEFNGRRNEITTFDIFHTEPDNRDEKISLLPLESYLLGLAESGYIPLSDLLHIESSRLHRTYKLLEATEAALEETRSDLGRKLIELEAANRVLRNRTEELISLQEIGQELIGTTTLRDLARHVCRQTSELCGADKAIFYFRRDDEWLDVIATYGWEPGRIPKQTQIGGICDPEGSALAIPYSGLPPGVKPGKSEKKPAAGLRIPLVVQGVPVGAMIVHSNTKPKFPPGAVALLQTFANQAAIAIQRASLIESLQTKIAQLEAAQEGLAQKERMERELELARDVQQAILPRKFPIIPGYAFSAHNKPARVVGGDFYDVIDLGSGKLGLVIADVSDKGMPAAVYMALTRSLIVAEARREESPRKVLVNVNDLLLALGPARMFVTVFYGVLDTYLRKLFYARAGHDYPFLIRDGEIQPLCGEGVILGYIESKELHLTEETLSLIAGDRLLLYTDGLVDVVSPGGQRLKPNGFAEILKRFSTYPVKDLCTEIFSQIADFQGRTQQFDDMSLLVVEVLDTD